jgi:H+-transporting ATPase
MPNNRDFDRLSIEESLEQLKTRPETGLSNEEVRERQQEFGRNEIPETEESLAKRILKRFWGPIPWMSGGRFPG